MAQTNEPSGRGVTWWYCECGEPLNGRLAREHECEATRRARGDGGVGDGE